MENHLVSRGFNKNDMVELVNNDIDKFNEGIALMLDGKEPLAWRSAWVLKHAMGIDDKRLVPFVSSLIASLKTGSEGYCRETINILIKMKWDDEQEGRLFDCCMDIWEKVNYKPGLRSKAFYVLCDIADRYPELKNELKFITADHYIENISHGIKKGILKKISKM